NHPPENYSLKFFSSKIFTLSLRQQQEVQKIWDIFLLTKTYQSGLEKMNKKMKFKIYYKSVGDE
ncbi:MAG: hypothetical protein RR766_05195, partial [Longicatena sp.]